MAGRTDAGVHARGQVVHLDVPAAAWSGPADTDRAPGWPGLLPADVRVRAAGPAPDGFDARFSALWRRYAYRVCDDEAAADPLRRHETLWYFRRLDLAAMNEAGRQCLGEHDFAAFCRRREGATTIRALRTLDYASRGPIKLRRRLRAHPNLGHHLQRSYSASYQRARHSSQGHKGRKSQIGPAWSGSTVPPYAVDGRPSRGRWTKWVVT